jgi:alkanesulfonate monooxygenase SsuD/methylene tetrahydromethanopterin reductase-like flavin-dependent oxidoreductase (luciferase family)
VDALLVHGSPERCRERITAYVENGVTVPVPALLPTPDQGARALAAAVKAVSPS